MTLMIDLVHSAMFSHTTRLHIKVKGLDIYII